MSPSDALSCVISCEHASNRVPPKLRRLFAPHHQLLDSHRGWDPGTLLVARQLAAHCQVRPHLGRWTRLLVELNRSLHHRNLFSVVTRDQPRELREQWIQEYWQPYRAAVEAEIAEKIETYGRVIHLSIHSFTPVLDGVQRNADFGLLFDPRRSTEKGMVHQWLARFRESSQYRVRKNYPYRGIGDGFTTHLRRKYHDDQYAGIEIEINQALVGTVAEQKRVAQALIDHCLKHV